MVSIIIFLGIALELISPTENSNSNKQNISNVKNEIDERTTSENLDRRAKKYNEIYDKYEKIISRNRGNPIKTIEILRDEGFSLSNTVRFPGGLIAYSYTKYVDGFNVEVIYSDSPNPQYNEVVMGTITDTQF